MSGEPPQNSNPDPPKPSFSGMAQPTAHVSDFSSHPTLKTGTIEHLKPPGPDSNYSEWSWLQARQLGYLLRHRQNHPPGQHLLSPKIQYRCAGPVVCSPSSSPGHLHRGGSPPKQTHLVGLFDMPSNIIVRCYIGQACPTWDWTILSDAISNKPTGWKNNDLLGELFAEQANDLLGKELAKKVNDLLAQRRPACIELGEQSNDKPFAQQANDLLGEEVAEQVNDLLMTKSRPACPELGEQANDLLAKIFAEQANDLLGEIFAEQANGLLAKIGSMTCQLFAEKVIDQLSELFTEQVVGLLGKYLARQATASRSVACLASSEQAGLLTCLASSEQADLLFASRSSACSATSSPSRSFDLLAKSWSMTFSASSEQVIGLLSEDLAEQATGLL
ncbi:hypothetical protein PCANC_28442 [Puccinia coronata f. sp. avenae]|uniref:Uncharacterized protein n=1 Tax=Puccinia coronata f. sp. avenae TaxID=200324 RepID=A0A2N5RV66_9BASI|nr:hypothetical protein PCANC_28442 [Puccinia coronata f. sp. avenae]